MDENRDSTTEELFMAGGETDGSSWSWFLPIALFFVFWSALVALALYYI